MTSLIGQIVLGWLLADFLGGVMHWLEDRILADGDGFIGRHIVAPNRLHHSDPVAMFNDDGLLDRNWTTWLAVAPLSLGIAALSGFSLLWLTATLGGLLTYEVHRVAHRPSNAPEWLRVLQETGLLQSPKHHAGHHRPPSDRRYCLLTDLLNPLLDHVDLWGRVERGLLRLRLPISLGER